MYPVSSDPCGRSWARWVQLWWNWCYSEPLEKSPVSDSSGEFCTRGQTYEKVWFLAGTFGGKAERKCKIPQGRSIFFPVLTNLISFATDPHLKTEGKLRAYAKADMDEAKFPTTRANVDGLELQDMKKYRIQTPLFELVLPPRGFKAAQAGSWLLSQVPATTQAVSDGYWVFLKPLPSGEHKIEFVGEKLEYDKRVIRGVEQNIDVPRFRVDVTYYLMVS